MKEISRRRFVGGMVRAGGGLALAVAGGWGLTDGGVFVPRVAEASPIRRIVPLQAHEVPEQITRIIETPLYISLVLRKDTEGSALAPRTPEQIIGIFPGSQDIYLVIWKDAKGEASPLSEAIAEFEKEKERLNVQSVWRQVEPGSDDLEGYIPGAPAFATPRRLEQVPPEARLYFVAPRKPIEAPAAPQTPTPTPAGGSEKFPAPPTQGSDTPPELAPKPAFKEGVNRDAGRLAVERLNDYRANGAKILVYGPDGSLVRYGGGIAPLQANSILATTAEKYAQFVAYRDPYLRSKDPHALDGEPWDRAEREGYTNRKAFAEVLGADFALFSSAPDWLAEGAINGWFHSRPHREALLNTKYREVGFGFYLIEGTRVGPDRNGRTPQVLVIEVGLVGSR